MDLVKEVRPKDAKASLLRHILKCYEEVRPFVCCPAQRERGRPTHCHRRLAVQTDLARLGVEEEKPPPVLWERQELLLVLCQFKSLARLASRPQELTWNSVGKGKALHIHTDGVLDAVKNLLSTLSVRHKVSGRVD